MDLGGRPLRVGLDLRLAGYRSGGISRYALELASALERVPDINVQPLRHHSDPTALAHDIKLRTPAHHRLETHALGIELALKRISLDVYHATDFVGPRLLRAPVVATVHDLAFLRWPDQLSRDALRYYRQVRSQSGRIAHWITPSRWTRSELTDLVGVPAEKVTVIPHGLSSFISRDDIRPRESRKPYLLAIGTIEPRKRYDLLLDAFDRLKPRPELHIVGAPGWNTGALQDRLRGTAGVVWHENAGDAEVDQLISNALAVAIPSLAEGFGLGALEAMAHGTPVISSGLGALSEVTGPAAHVPALDEPVSWAEAIQYVVEDAERWNELSSMGAERALEFSWEEAALRTAAVYRLVAG